MQQCRQVVPSTSTAGPLSRVNDKCDHQVVQVKCLRSRNDDVSLKQLLIIVGCFSKTKMQVKLICIVLGYIMRHRLMTKLLRYTRQWCLTFLTAGILFTNSMIWVSLQYIVPRLAAKLCNCGVIASGNMDPQGFWGSCIVTQPSTSGTRQIKARRRQQNFINALH